jgi:hypothetical protein
MSKCWQPNEDGKFARQLQFNKPYYVIRPQARNLAPYEDANLYDEYVFTERAPLTGTPMTAGGTTAKQLCRNMGPVYDTKPAGMRRMGSPGPQVAGPVPQGYEGVLDEAELRGLEKQVRDGSDPRKRRPLGGWRV